MELRPSQTLSNYRLVRQIGEGGMGIVWQAHDTTLDREVAIKILPTAFADNADRLARFEREARLLASLNHPNIATIHGLHEHQGIRFLAMELVGGEDLAHVVKLGPLPLEEVLEIGRHIAAALEEAHRNGVVHRDLKPANVRVTDSRQVKVLDFGLARRNDSAIVASPDSETITQPGYIVGTAQYMSPEQVRGMPVDKQADVWAFGCVLFEMLTGMRAFGGETASDCISIVLTAEPDFDKLPPTCPPPLRRLIRRCLEKDPRRRWRDIGDVRIELEELAAGWEPDREQTEAIPERPTSPASRLAPWVVALAALVVALAWWWRTPAVPSVDRPVVRTTLAPAPGVALHARYATVAVPSPDGSQVVYVGVSEGRQQLWLRSLDDLMTRALPGTDDAWQPFFSPDGSWIGFFADRKLKKVPVDQGHAETIVEIGSNPRGGSWGADGWIVVAPTQTSGLIRVNADDGATESLTDLDFARGESTHRWPQVLPEERGVLYTSRSVGDSFDRANIVADPLDGGEARVIVEHAAHGRYIRSGHVVFVRGGGLFAVPFDLQRLQATGEPVRMIDGVTCSRRNGGAQFAVSDNGTLVYRPGAASTAEAVPLWVDESGVTRPIDDTYRQYGEPRLSPDGTQLLVSIFDGQASKLWTLDIARGTFSQVTHRDAVGGRWVDADRGFVVYAAGETNQLSLYLRRGDGMGEAQSLTSSQYRQVPCAVSPDGRSLVYQERHPDTGWDLLLLELNGDGNPVGEPRVLLATPSNEEKAHFSRDGDFLAYESDEMDGVVQVYARSFPGMENKRQVSERGARAPRFSRTQDEIYFWSTGLQQFRRARYTIEPGALSIETPTRILATRAFSAAAGGAAGVLADPSFSGYDVDPMGERFVMLELEQAVAPLHDGEIVLVLNWFDELGSEPVPAR